MYIKMANWLRLQGQMNKCLFFTLSFYCVMESVDYWKSECHKSLCPTFQVQHHNHGTTVGCSDMDHTAQWLPEAHVYSKWDTLSQISEKGRKRGVQDYDDSDYVACHQALLVMHASNATTARCSRWCSVVVLITCMCLSAYLWLRLVMDWIVNVICSNGDIERRTF